MDVFLYTISRCLPCFPTLGQPHVSINGTTYAIVRLLGEGGFSYVYLVLGRNNALFALKKMCCPYGANDERFRMALKEIRHYHRFALSKTPYIVHSIDEAIVDEADGSKTIYVVLPYFERSLQDVLTSNVLAGERMPEADIVRIFVGVCRGVQAMHKYKVYANTTIEDEEDDLLLPQGADDDDDDAQIGSEMLELRPFAHRDIKPANVMLSTEGLPVLVDLGSCTRARVLIKTRQQALTLTDYAQDHCTLPYRCPELLDVPTGAEITESTDIWSLGCVLYACMYGVLPFEKIEIEQGANISLAISQGRYAMPDDDAYSPAIKALVRKCLQLKPTDRPTIDEVLEEALEIHPV